MTDAQKHQIDGMSREEMAAKWRFAAPGDPLLQGDTGQYFADVFFKGKGGFSPEISKGLGWTPPA